MIRDYLKNPLKKTSPVVIDTDGPCFVNADEFDALIEQACDDDSLLRSFYHVTGNVDISDKKLEALKARNPMGDFIAATGYSRILTINGNLNSTAKLVTDLAKLEEVNGDVKITNPDFNDLSSLKAAKNVDIGLTSVKSLPALSNVKNLKCLPELAAQIPAEKLNKPIAFNAPVKQVSSNENLVPPRVSTRL